LLSPVKSSLLIHGINNYTRELISGVNTWYENPAWSPDGQNLAFGMEETQSATGPLCYLDINASSSNGEDKKCLSPNQYSDYPNWSKDGLRIIFSSGDSLYSGRKQRDLYIWDLGSQDVIRLTNTSEAEISPKWSPDGSRLAFLSRREGEYNFTLYLANADGSNRIPVAGTGDISAFDWSPDGNRIVYTEMTGNGNNECDFGCLSFRILKIIDLDTGIIQSLTDGTEYIGYPSWRP
jgi:Tol biopolymer transport system component